MYIHQFHILRVLLIGDLSTFIAADDKINLADIETPHRHTSGYNHSVFLSPSEFFVLISLFNLTLVHRKSPEAKIIKYQFGSASIMVKIVSPWFQSYELSDCNVVRIGWVSLEACPLCFARASFLWHLVPCRGFSSQ